MKNQSKRIYIIILIAVVILIAGYLYWLGSQKQPEDKAAEPLKASAPAVSGTLPSINTQTNVLEKVPEINPVDKANPFKDVYKNPFQ